jgi:hypothetical protein
VAAAVKAAAVAAAVVLSAQPFQSRKEQRIPQRLVRVVLAAAVGLHRVIQAVTPRFPLAPQTVVAVVELKVNQLAKMVVAAAAAARLATPVVLAAQEAKAVTAVLAQRITNIIVAVVAAVALRQTVQMQVQRLAVMAATVRHIAIPAAA